jgi:hypothetical protein
MAMGCIASGCISARPVWRISFAARGGCRNGSLRETCRLQGRPTFPVLVDAVTCSFNRQHPDLSWIYMLTP